MIKSIDPFPEKYATEKLVFLTWEHKNETKQIHRRVDWGILRQAEAVMRVVDLCRQNGITMRYLGIEDKEVLEILTHEIRLGYTKCIEMYQNGREIYI